MRTPKSLLWIVICLVVSSHSTFGQSPAPVPLLTKDREVDWWFAFKLNTKGFPGCGPAATRSCPFGGTVKTYKAGFGQQYISASSENPSLQKGEGCIGTTDNDPVGATFGQIYEGPYFYVVWNDDFKDEPKMPGGAGWGHAKGMVAWGESGDGVVMQVTTPSWPGAGSSDHPRKKVAGNTLGCLPGNNVLVSQHFFALRLTKDDLIQVLAALENASVPTDPSNLQLVRNGGPEEVQVLVERLGKRSSSTTAMSVSLSSGVLLISKPSKLEVPPWQMISAMLDKTPLRAATWWATPYIPTTTPSTKIGCWDKDQLGKPGTVEIALTGSWDGKPFGLQGSPSADKNHAKIGVSLAGDRHYVIFGDMNQQGVLSGKCSRSQNGRGGLFFVIDDEDLHGEVARLIEGDTASTKIPAPKKPQ